MKKRPFERLRRVTRRLYPRTPVELQIHYRTSGSFLASYTVNLSRGGLFIETEDPLDVGSQVSLKLEVPGVDKSLEAKATVVWVRAKNAQTGQAGGMGMRFEDSDEQWSDVVDRLVKTFSGFTVVIVGESATRRTSIGRLVRGVLSCKIQELDPDAMISESATARFDLAVVDIDGGAAITQALGTLRGVGTPIIALASALGARDLAQSFGASESLEASPSPGELRSALLRALSRPTVVS